jgi:hypothetical protein
MTNGEPTSPAMPTYAGGCLAITETPVVGTPRREHAEVFAPGVEELEDGEIRVRWSAAATPG